MSFAFLHFPFHFEVPTSVTEVPQNLPRQRPHCIIRRGSILTSVAIGPILTGSNCVISFLAGGAPDPEGLDASEEALLFVAMFTLQARSKRQQFIWKRSASHYSAKKSSIGWHPTIGSPQFRGEEAQLQL